MNENKEPKELFLTLAIEQEQVSLKTERYFVYVFHINATNVDTFRPRLAEKVRAL